MADSNPAPVEAEGIAKVDGEINVSFDVPVDKPEQAVEQAPVRRRTRRSSVEPLLTGAFTYTWVEMSVETTIMLNKWKKWKCWKGRQWKANFPGTTIPILRNLSGKMKSGELWALMGASGAGKTSLLNTLNFRNENHVNVTGERCINGVPVDPEIVSAVSGYLQQDDILPDALTCREHLLFTAHLRLPRHLSSKQRQERVDEVLQDVGLWEVRNSFIGTLFTKGISGGEKKRLSFASEILTEPSILFCDEPTTGLDGYMASKVVEIMKGIASHGKLVVCTIHQPSTEVFKLFDHLYLLSEGRLAYAGDRLMALDFFASQGYECPLRYNPADFYIHTMAIVPGNVKECKEKTAAIVQAFSESEQYKEIQAGHTRRKKTSSALSNTIKELRKPRKYEANPFVQIAVLFVRYWKIEFRTPNQLLADVIAYLFLGLFFGSLISEAHLDFVGIGSVSGVILQAMMVQMFIPCYIIITDLPNEIPFIMREHWNGLYALVPCYVARSLREMLTMTLLPFLFTPIFYYYGHLSGPSWRLLYHLITIVLASNAGIAAGGSMSYLSTSIPMALVNACFLLTPFLLFCGFFADEENLPFPCNHIRYGSISFYAAENVMAIHWEGVGKEDIHFGKDTPQGVPELLQDGKKILKFYQYEVEMKLLWNALF